MKILIDVLKSRTVWTIFFMFIIAGVEGVREFIPTEVQPYVFGVVSLIAMYFRLVPKQNYNV
jgi:hypothetical protein